MSLRQGVYPASVTPFDERGAVDDAGVVRLLAWFRAAGCQGVVLAGTNGEGPSLSAVEKRDLVRLAVPLAEGLDIVLGVATASLEEAVWSCEQARKAGAAAALVMPPSYFREAAGTEGIALWFESLLRRTSLPVLVYNFPQRTGIELAPELVARLSRFDTMIGVKDSSGVSGNLQSYSEALRGRNLFVGDETLLWEALELGWTGTISGAANVLPGWLAQIVAERPSNGESARAKFDLILDTLKWLRSVPQPAGVKNILSRLGVLPSGGLRLPLLPVEVAQELVAAVSSLNGA